MNPRQVLISSLRVWLIFEPVDMRLSIDGLSARLKASLGGLPAEGTAFVFSNRRHDRLKVLVWDGNGVWLAQRRLHRGHFTWPQSREEKIALDEESWRWLIAGVDWQRANPRMPAAWQT